MNAKMMPLVRNMSSLFVTSLMLFAFGCGGDEGEDLDAPVRLDCDELAAGMTLEDRNDKVDYIVSCVVDLQGTLTIKPGVKIEFEDDAGLYNEVEASAMDFQGTAAKPIILTSASGQKGAWKGVHVGSQSTKNIFDHVTIEYAGGEAFDSNDYRGAIVLYGKLTIKNSTLKDSLNYGITSYDDTSLTFENNTITGCGKEPLALPARHMHQLDAASKLTGNASDYVLINTPEAAATTATWRKLTVPYLVSIPTFEVLGLGDGAKVTIEPGVELRFASNNGLSLVGDSSLVAKGTADAKIRFIGVEENATSWRGIYYESKSTLNALDHVEIAYAGSDSFNSNDNVGAIVVFSEARVSVSNTVIRDSGECGVSAEYDMSMYVDAGGNTFTNVAVDVCLVPEL